MEVLPRASHHFQMRSCGEKKTNFLHSCETKSGGEDTILTQMACHNAVLPADISGNRTRVLITRSISSGRSLQCQATADLLPAVQLDATVCPTHLCSRVSVQGRTPLYRLTTDMGYPFGPSF